MKPIIEIPRTYTARQLLAVMKFVETNPNVLLRVNAWPYQDMTPTEYREWFMAKLNEKINRQDTRTWRKLDRDYQRDLAHDAREIRDYTQRRIIHSGCRGLLRTPELKRRYPHINRQDRD